MCPAKIGNLLVLDALSIEIVLLCFLKYIRSEKQGILGTLYRRRNLHTSRTTTDSGLDY